MADVTYYYDSWNAYDWTTDPDYMVDNILTNFASTDADGDFERLYTNTCPGTDLGTITSVEIRAYGYGDGDDRIDFRPYPGGVPGDVYQTTPANSAGWGSYVDITSDTSAPSPWTWSDVQATYCYVYFDKVGRQHYVLLQGGD